MRKYDLLKEPQTFHLNDYLSEISIVCKNCSIDLLYFFGGYANGKISKLSDLDFAYYSAKKIDADKLFIKFSTLFHREDIDLVDLRQAPSLISFQAIKTGKLLFCSNDKIKPYLEYSIITKYLNTRHLRSRFHESFKDAVLKGNFYAQN